MTLKNLLTVIFVISLLTSLTDSQAQEIILKSVLHTKQLSGMVPSYGITRADIDKISRLEGITKAVPIRVIPRAEMRYGERVTQSNLVGTTHDILIEKKSKTITGRYLVEKDISNLNNVTVISHINASRLFGNEDALGKNVRVDNDYYLVVGVIASEKNEAYIPISTMRSRMGDLLVSSNDGSFRAESFEVSEVRIHLNPDSDPDNIVQEISNLLESSHKIQDYSINLIQ